VQRLVVRGAADPSEITLGSPPARGRVIYLSLWRPIFAQRHAQAPFRRLAGRSAIPSMNRDDAGTEA
jgi:hypothetical protein